MKNETIKKITDLFLKYGIKSVSMDDIARELCISKKTLYQYFSDKQDVVIKSVEYSIKEQISKIEEFGKIQSNNAIDILLLVSKELISNGTKINMNINYDLQKYYPKAWEVLTKHRQENVFERISENIQKGIKEKLYRDNFNIDVISYFYMNHIETAFNNIVEKTNIGISEILETLFIYHIRGIASNKGIKYIDLHLKNKKLKKYE